MEFFIGADIRILDPTPELIDFIKREYTVSNPNYVIARKLGKNTRWMSPYLQLYYQKAFNEYVLPFGTLNQVWKFFNINRDKYTLLFHEFKGNSIKGDINLYGYQNRAVETLVAKKGGVLEAPCGSGKGLPLDTLICTPNGFVKNGDLKIGDYVIGSDGKPTKVIGIFDRGLVDAYKIIFDDETNVICDKDHLWNVQKQWEREENKGYKTITTENIYNLYSNNFTRSKYLYIPLVKPVIFEKKKIPLNPYFLGLLLGDGILSKKSLGFSNSEKDIVDKLKELTVDAIKQKNKYDYYFNGKDTKNKLKELGLLEAHSYEKFIPDIYKYNSCEIRLNVLRGLFDTDGYIGSCGIYEYSSASKRLANDFVEIVRSLGGTAKIHSRIPHFTYKGKRKEGRINYRVFFKLGTIKPFISVKHNQKNYNRVKYTKPYKIIKKIEKVKPIISRCIKVDAKDELYVIKDYIVTHNTQIGLALIKKIGGKALWLTHTKYLLNQSLTRAKLYFTGDFGTITEGKVNMGKDITFATVQTMRELDPSIYKDEFDMVVVDESHKVVGAPDKVMQFYKVLSNINARYKYGMSATLTRSDGLIKSMFAIIGEKAYSISKEEVGEKIIKAKHIRINWNKEYTISQYTGFDGMLDYAKLIDLLSNDKERNDFIIDNILAYRNKKQLVLCNRISQIEYIEKELLKKNLIVGKITGKTHIKDRNFDKDVILATFQLAKEGIDIPTLNIVHFAMPQKEKSIVLQSAGRVERNYKGKETPMIFDYVDSSIFYCEYCYKKRKNLLK